MLFGITGYECGGEPILRIIKFVMDLINIVLFIVPIGLILMISVDFMKSVIAGKDDEMKKNVNLVIKRIIMAVALFLVPTIVKFSCTLLEDVGLDYAGCIEIATKHDLSQYKVNLPIDDYENPEVNLGKPSGLIPSEDQDIGNPDDPSTTTDPEDEEEDEDMKTIYIGDSRFVGMKSAVGSDDIWICETGKGYKWFNSTALSQLDEKISDGGTYNVVINLGVNDPGNTASYLNVYKKLASNSKYENCNFIIVSVNPISDTKAAKNGYTVKNSQVIKFNNHLKKSLPSSMKYCDTYSKISSSFETNDGIHYRPVTYKKIYNEIQNCL